MNGTCPAVQPVGGTTLRRHQSVLPLRAPTLLQVVSVSASSSSRQANSPASEVIVAPWNSVPSVETELGAEVDPLGYVIKI